MLGKIVFTVVAAAGAVSFFLRSSRRRKITPPRHDPRPHAKPVVSEPVDEPAPEPIPVPIQSQDVETPPELTPSAIVIEPVPPCPPTLEASSDIPKVPEGNALRMEISSFERALPVSGGEADKYVADELSSILQDEPEDEQRLVSEIGALLDRMDTQILGDDPQKTSLEQAYQEILGILERHDVVVVRQDDVFDVLKHRNIAGGYVAPGTGILSIIRPGLRWRGAVVKRAVVRLAV